MAGQTVASGQADDVELALRMMEGDEVALSLVIRNYGPKVMGALRNKFGNQVTQDVLEDAINRAAFSLWRNADSFDDSKGSLGALFYSCAWREVINIVRNGKKTPPHTSFEDLDKDISAPQSTSLDGDEENISPEKQKRHQDLLEVIKSLPQQQRAIAEADLISGCLADNDDLAKTLGTSKNSIYVSRTKARENIRQEMRKRGHFK